MNIKKSLAIVTLAGVLFGAGFYSNDLSKVTVRANTTGQNSDQGKIIVHYVDQNGNPIRPETVATGATGTTYVASVPQIKGYTYSSIENGQNNANGPQMVFGGGDPVTSVMSMTIVYNATSSKAANDNKNSTSSSSNSNSNNNSSTVDTPENNHKSSTSNQQTSEKSSNKNSSTSKVKPNSTTSNKQNASNSNDNSADESDSKNQPAKSTKAKQNTDKKTKNHPNDDTPKKTHKSESTKDNHHLAWIIGGVILVVVVVSAGVWKFMKKPRSDRH